MKTVEVNKNSFVLETGMHRIFRVWQGNFALVVWVPKGQEHAPNPQDCKLYRRFLHNGTLREIESGEEGIAWFSAFGVRSLDDFLIVQGDRGEYAGYGKTVFGVKESEATT